MSKIIEANSSILPNLTIANAVILAIISITIYLFLDWVGVIGPHRIKGIPSVNGYPIIGILFQVIKDPAKKYMEWSKLYGDVFQMRMGSRMIIVANSYESVKELWLKNRDANNSRPMLYTFHSVLSKTQGFTIGTTPYGQSYKNKKKIVATSLNKKSVESYNGLISQESVNMFRRIEEELLFEFYETRERDIDLFKLIQGFVLRISLYLTYGYLVKVEHNDKCKLFDEITHVENSIVRLRGHNSNLQDYLPILRYLPVEQKTRKANDYRQRRDVYMSKFINGLIEKMEKQEDYKDSIVSRALRGCTEYPHDVTEEEIKSVCLTMVSAGLDNTPLVINHVLGHLSQPITGLKFQERAIQNIVKVHGSLEDAFHACIDGYHVDYVEALLREGLRYFSVLPTSLPRVTTKDIIFRNSVIPSGTIMFMNVFAANHDKAYFYKPYEFLPERYLNKEGKLDLSSTMFTFGIGSRMCAGSHLAMKEMYITLIRTLVLYKLHPPKNPKYLMEMDPFKLNSVPKSVAFEPYVYKINLEIRDQDMFDRIVSKKK